MNASKIDNRTMYLVMPRHISYLETYEITNEETLLTHRAPGHPNMFVPRLHQPGFWDMAEKPVIVMKKSCQIPNRDIDLMRAFWIVSERCKNAVTAVDAPAFEFLECECYDKKGKVLEKRWLCAVMRTLDVLDEQATKVNVARGANGAKGYYIDAYDNMVFRVGEIAEDVHIFNMAHVVRQVVVDNTFKEAMKLNEMKNFGFQDVSRRQMPRPR